MKDFEVPRAAQAGPHPAPELLLTCAKAPDDPASQLVLRHAATCGQCSTELAHIEAFQAHQAMSQASREAAWRQFATPHRPYPPRRLRAWTVAAAAAVVAVGVSLPFLLKSSASRPEIERGSPGTAALVSPIGSIERAPEEFDFRNPSGRLVRVAVFDAARSFNWTSESTTSGRVVLPQEMRARLLAGDEYFWTLVGTGSAAPVASFRIKVGAEPR